MLFQLRGNSVVQSKNKQNFILDFCQSLEKTVFSGMRTGNMDFIIIFAQLKHPLYDAHRFPQHILKASTAVVANNLTNKKARPVSAPSLLV